MHLQKNKMRIFIDADGCPVTESAINFAKQHNIECYVVCDTSHEFSFNYASVITVSKGKDSASTREPSVSKAARLITFFNSRTFPYQG